MPGNLRNFHWERDLDFAKHHRHRLPILWPEGVGQEVLIPGTMLRIVICHPSENREVILVPDPRRVPPQYQSWLCGHPLRREAKTLDADSDPLASGEIMPHRGSGAILASSTTAVAESPGFRFLGSPSRGVSKLPCSMGAWRPRGPATQLKPGDPATVALEAKIALSVLGCSRPSPPQTPRV